MVMPVSERIHVRAEHEQHTLVVGGIDIAINDDHQVRTLVDDTEDRFDCTGTPAGLRCIHGSQDHPAKSPFRHVTGRDSLSITK